MSELNIKTKKMAGLMPQLLTQVQFMNTATQYTRNSNISRFQDSWLYYRALRPVRESWEGSNYVEPVLRDCIDQIRPSLLNVFTENDEQAVIFRPQTTKIGDAITSAVNKKINDIFLRENEGKRIMGDVFVEGLVTGDTFMKFFIEEVIDEVPFEIEEWLPKPALEMILEMYPDTDITKLEEQESALPDGTITTSVKGSLVLIKINRTPRLEHVTSNDIFVDDTHGVNIKDSRYIGHRRIMTVGEGIELGFSEEDMIGASTFNSLNEMPMSTKRLVVDKVLTNIDDVEVMSIDPMERKVVVWEHYIYSSLLDTKNKTKLYQVFATDSAIMRVTEVSRMPFVHGVPESIPGSFWGGSMYDRTRMLQDQMSKFARLEQNIATNAAHNRFVAMSGAYDRQSLLSNRPGSVVEVKEVGAIGLMPQPSSPPSLDGAMMRLAQTKERTISTSVGSALAGGSLSGVAASTVAMTIANEELKDKVIAKSFAWTLIKPIFELIYETIRDEDYTLELENVTEGEPTTIKGSLLPPRADFTIDVNTSNDDSVTSNNLLSIVSTFSQISQMPVPIITEQNAFNIAETLCKLNGITDVDKYFTDPSKLPEPTPEELEAAQQEQQYSAATSQANLDLLTAQVQAAGAEIAKIEKETEELLKKGQAERDKLITEGKIAYEKLAIERTKAEILYKKYELDKLAVDAEIILTEQTGSNISISGAR